MTKAKKVIAGAGLVALTAITNIDASENNVSQEERARIDRAADDMLNKLDKKLQQNKAEKQTKRPASSNEGKLVKDGLKELELEEQFKKSPYLYQKYNGYIDRYVKVAKTLTPTESKQAAKAIAELDKKYFNSLCEDSDYGTAYNSNFVYDTEIKNGERHLVHNADSYVLCGPEDSDWVEVFRFSSEHCELDTHFCYAHQFGLDMVCSCHVNNNIPDDNEILINSLLGKPVSSLKQANDKKAAMVQSMLYVNGR